MGNYTSLSDFAASSWASRRRRPANTRESTEATIDESPYLCPRCEEGYAFPSACARCGEPTVDRRRVLPLPKPVDSRGSLARDGAFAGIIFFGLVAILPAIYVVLRQVDRLGGSADPSTLATFFALGTGLVATLAAPALIRRASAALRRRADLRDARRTQAALAAHPAIDTRALPEETTGNGIRLRGTVRFEPDDHRVRVRVADEHGSVVLPRHGDYRAYDAATLARLEALEDGDEVELVAHGLMHAVAAESYRNEGHEFIVDGEHPIHVWVERRRAT